MIRASLQNETMPKRISNSTLLVPLIA